MEQLKLMQDIETCRTAAFGGHLEQCDNCGFTRNAYNSCRNRHCPKCQGAERLQWLNSRQDELLPVEYFHVVFTLPKVIEEIAFYNKKNVYNILFDAAAQALLAVGGDPQLLGAEIGFFAVLHTWGQNMEHHPHLHCLVPAGGLSPDRKSWISCLPGFFLPLNALSEVFRCLFLRALEEAFQANELKFFGKLARLRNATAFSDYLAPEQEANWAVYAKPPMGGPQQVLEYLCGYTHRVAITNDRLLSLEGGKVTFRWRDYRHKHKQNSKTMSLSADEFIRRFLLHTLPKRFQRIRHFGFLANRHRRERLALCRQLLNTSISSLSQTDGSCDFRELPSEPAAARCPQCGMGKMVRTAILPPYCWSAHSPTNTS